MPRSSNTHRQPAPIIATALAAMVLSFGLLFGVQYADKTQNIRPQAAAGPSVRLRYSGQTVNPGELRINLLLNTDASAIGGTQVKLRLAGSSANNVSVELGNSLNLETISSKVYDQSGTTVIEFTQFASLDPAKPATTHGQEVKIGSITVRSSQGGNFTLTTDLKTAVPVLNDSSIVLDTTQSQSFTLAAGGNGGGNSSSPLPQLDNKKTCNQSCSGDSECNSNLICYKGYCRGFYDKEDSTCRGVGDQGIHRGCNEYCADKNECGNGLSCYFNQCRNPRNLGNGSCSNPASPRPIVYVTQPALTKGGLTGTGATPTPVPSSSPTPLASPSPSPSPTYDEDKFRVSPSPTLHKPSPVPVAVSASSSGSNKLVTAGIITLFALVIVIPVGIYLYRRVR